ncbi:membrane protein [Hylemonella gracilis str. Niagara R]|uniref:Membrane protein n=1 Tax=Hylemonella gracilis str. Niagara R TaxID=1458275 RepID=A0A016XE01_9BURK|nr:2TM domain-containing protein [Hylemonella gracilis]EYC50110.1 membrane protein [Hylemonella gracilis str. Niagara R]
MRSHDPEMNDLERRARRRAGAKLGWYIHATIYVAVNLLLMFLSAQSPRGWAIYPAMGWGMGLAIHGLVVFVLTTGVHERLVQRERRRLMKQPGGTPS